MNDAWNKWLESEQGQKAADGDTLELSGQGNMYLVNRLWWAFQAGLKAVEEKKENEVTK